MRPTSLVLLVSLCMLTGCPHPAPTPPPAPPAAYYCSSTDPRTTPFPGPPYYVLPGSPTSNGQFQYSGQVLAHTPNGNGTFCPIRQTYFEVPPTLQNPTIQTVLVHHGGGIVEWPIAYDTADAGLNGNMELYRTDAQAVDPMLGDYDLIITITGTSKTAPK